MSLVPISNYAESGITTPAGNALVITPADSDLASITRSIYVGGTGDLAVTMAGGGNIVIFPSVPAGAILPIRASQIRSTATTATLIVAMW